METHIVMFPIAIPELVDMIASKVKDLLNNTNSDKPVISENESRLLGDRAAAVYLGCTVQTIGKLRKNREIPYHRYGRKYYYIGSELDKTFKTEARRFGELRGTRKG